MTLELELAGSIPSIESHDKVAQANRKPRLARRGLAAAASAVVILVVAIGLGRLFFTSPEEIPVGARRSSLNLPASAPMSLSTMHGLHNLAVSPDGSLLAYVANVEDVVQLVLRRLDGFETEPLDGTEGAANPFFSPDSEWVAFFAEGELKKVSVRGGSPIVLADVGATGLWLNGTWGDDGSIFFFGGRDDGILRVPASGGSIEVLTVPDPEGTSHFFPHILPGSTKLLAAIESAENDGKFNGSYNPYRIAVVSVEDGTFEVVLEEGYAPRYVPTGHILYELRGRLMAVPFDAEGGTLKGTPSLVPENRLADQVTLAGRHRLAYSNHGTLVYVPSSETAAADRSLVWVDRDGQQQSLPGTSPRRYGEAEISPSGDRLAVTIGEDIWILRLGQAAQAQQLTFGLAAAGSVHWTPDGQRIFFASEQDGPTNVYWKRSDGTGSAEQISNSPRLQFPTGWTPEGHILVNEWGSESCDVNVISIEEGGTSRRLIGGSGIQGDASVSPNGRWISYMSTETGRREVYVRTYPNVAEGKWLVSTWGEGGGAQPSWSVDGRELFYSQGHKIIAVSAGDDKPFEHVEAQLLFDGPDYATTGLGGLQLSSHRDGRFLMRRESAVIQEFAVVENWFEELKRLVPTD